MKTYEQIKEIVRRELRVQRMLATQHSEQVLNCPLLMGPTGIGKTAMAREMAREFNVELVVVNGGENTDATDVTGIPDMLKRTTVCGTGGAMETNSWLLNKGARTACTKPTLFFIDDLDKASDQVQAALLGITGNRMFRDDTMHPESLIMGAGNRLGDDRLSSELSQSLLTRMTVIEMLPNVTSFCTYGTEAIATDGNLVLHPVIAGYLQWRPEHLYLMKEAVNRYPTPRGWVEASRQMYAYPDAEETACGEPNWKSVVSRKCGNDVGSDFWAWYTILRTIDVHRILQSGWAAPNGLEAYAAIYVVARHLNEQGVPPAAPGLFKFVASATAELHVAFLMQLNKKAKAQLSASHPDVSALLMKAVVRSGDPRVAT